MSIKVNPPPQVRIPEIFLDNPDTRGFFEQQRTILFQLWQRTGGSQDTVSSRQVIVIASTDVILDRFGQLIIVDASDSAIQITLPPITLDNVGESLDVAIVDATNDTIVVPQNATVFGDTSVVMTQQYMSIQYTAITTSVWIGT